MSWDFSSVVGSNSDKPRVLLVDQEAAYTAMLRQYLERHGFAVEHVTNGREALGRIAAIRPQLVVLDWTLPVMTSIEVCRRLRSRPMTRDLGVIMATRRAGDRNVAAGPDTGPIAEDPD